VASALLEAVNGSVCTEGNTVSKWKTALGASLAGLLVVAASWALPAPTPAAPPAIAEATKLNGVDWRALTDPADKALVAAGAILDGRESVKVGDTFKTGGFTFTISAAQATMDAGCDVTSSNPGGYDLCGATSWPDGDRTSAWDTDTYQTCWAGMQERDVTTDDGWRVWAKCQFNHNGSVPAALQDITFFRARQRNGNPPTYDWYSLGTKDPAEQYCGACYWSSTTWRIKPNYQAVNHVSFIRESIDYSDTIYSFNANCVQSYAFDWPDAGNSVGARSTDYPSSCLD